MGRKETIYELFSKAVGSTSNIMYSYLLIILLLAVGLYFTFRTKFVQFRLLGDSIRLVTEKSTGENSVSAFQALMVSTASRVGTGNIVGVANAIANGGYGSVFIDTLLVCTATAMMCLSSAIVFVGALLDFGLVWNLADVLMGIMAIINLPSSSCWASPPSLF